MLPAYIALIIAGGMVAIGASVYELYTNPIGYAWFVLAALTLISGSATVKIPSIPATISISETFVFTSVLLFGPAAGTLTVALDGLIISFWAARRNPEVHRALFNASAPALSCWIGSQLFFVSSGIKPLVHAPSHVGDLLIPLLLFATVYFLLNSWAIACVIALERRTSPLTLWKDGFLWLSLNYFGGASIAALFVIVAANLGLSYRGLINSLILTVPLLLILYLTFRASMGRVEDANRHLKELNALYLSTVETLAMAIDAKDQITHGHIRRVQHLAIGLAREIGINDERQLRAIEASALLHDMGKLAVPEYILNKPGKLTPAEFERMKLHATVGADILASINFPYPVVPIVRHHHENWDGTGYPDGLQGETIPIGARILSVVDCFDALTSDRPYRPRLSNSDAMKIVAERGGTMYDQRIVDAFMRVHDRITPEDTRATPSAPALEAIASSAAPPSLHVDTKSRLNDINSSSEEMLTLYELSSALAGRTSLEDAVDIVARHLKRMIPVSTCALFVHDTVTNELVAEHVVGPGASLITGLRIPLAQRLTGWVGANRHTIVNSDPALDLGDLSKAVTPRLHSCLSTALLSGNNELVGVLTLYSTAHNAFTEDHRRIAEVVSHQVARLICLSARNNPSEARSLRDDITGLPTEERLQRFFALTREVDTATSGSTSILLIDLRGLERTQAQNGVEVARLALRKLVTTIRSTLRGGDVLFRYDVRRLAAVLALTDYDVADALAKELRDVIEGVAQEDPFLRDVSVSIGIAVAPDDGPTLNTVMQHALLRVSAPSDNPDTRVH